MSENTRLDASASAVADALRQTDDETRRRVAVTACETAVADAGLDDERLRTGLECAREGGAARTDAPARAVEALVRELDEIAWDVYEDGSASEADYLRAFRRARAAAAVAAALRRDSLAASLDAVYEASFGVEDERLVWRAVASVLGAREDRA
jgi:hypothetical protein